MGLEWGWGQGDMIGHTFFFGLCCFPDGMNSQITDSKLFIGWEKMNLASKTAAATAIFRCFL